MRRTPASLPAACILSLGSLLFMPQVLANRYSDRGGIADAEGRYSVVFGMDQALPNHQLTPGAYNPAVTQGDIRETICVRGYTKTIRPPEKYTERLKRMGIRKYGYS